jgi:hypothetical protein
MADSISSNQSSGSVSEESRICRICANAALTLVGHIQSSRKDGRVAAYTCSSCSYFSFFPILYTQSKAFDWDGVEYYLKRKDTLIPFFLKLDG